MSHPSETETQPANRERSVEVTDAARERSAELHKKLETSGEHSSETQAERVEATRHEVEAFFDKEAGKESKQGGEPSSLRAVRKVTKQTRDAAYNELMKLVRTELNGPSRAFSKVIHSPFVERSSEVIGGTLARPNAILAGSGTALVLVLSVYLLSRTFGYQLSGFETIGAFLLGWAVGLIYDYVRVMAYGRRS
jgi:hypothetical protein